MPVHPSIPAFQHLGACSKVFSRARNDYDEEAAYDNYMTPEPGFQSGPGDSADANEMAPNL